MINANNYSTVSNLNTTVINNYSSNNGFLRIGTKAAALIVAGSVIFISGIIYFINSKRIKVYVNIAIEIKSVALEVQNICNQMNQRVRQSNINREAFIIKGQQLFGYAHKISQIDKTIQEENWYQDFQNLHQLLLTNKNKSIEIEDNNDLIQRAGELMSSLQNEINAKEINNIESVLHNQFFKYVIIYGIIIAYINGIVKYPADVLKQITNTKPNSVTMRTVTDILKQTKLYL